MTAMTRLAPRFFVLFFLDYKALFLKAILRGALRVLILTQLFFNPIQSVFQFLILSHQIHHQRLNTAGVFAQSVGSISIPSI
jgi:hypothetical protein